MSTVRESTVAQPHPSGSWQLDMNGHTAYDRTLAILRLHEPPAGYYLAFSGGKDSVVLLEMARRAGVRYDAHYSVTTIDPPELVRLIRREYPEVHFEYPAHSFRWYVEREGLPCRKTRWCCRLLKERGGKGRIVLTGVRAEESPKRAKRGIVETCTRDKSKTFVHPLRDWTTEEIWQFIRSEHLPYCSLYDEGWKRLGCICCPMDEKITKSMARWPAIWEAAHRAALRRWETSHPGQSWRRHWRSGEDFWQWWLTRKDPMPADLSDEEEGMPSMLFSQGMVE